MPEEDVQKQLAKTIGEMQAKAAGLMTLGVVDPQKIGQGELKGICCSTCVQLSMAPPCPNACVAYSPG